MKIIPTTTWYLEIRKDPNVETQDPMAVLVKTEKQFVKPDDYQLPEGYRIVHHRPDISEYLSIYKEVGGDYNWFDRILMAEAELSEILTNKSTEILLLKYYKETAGFIEFDISNINETEIVYFGMCRKYRGRKAGFPFLLRAIEQAWQRPINRLWLHTCDLDHPAALPMYQKVGFGIYRTETIMQRVKNCNDK